jgi:hypothetical protein
MTKTIFAIAGESPAQFEEAARLSAAAGASHLVVTEDLPPALWQCEPPGDPYPAWYVKWPGLLKTFPPAEILPFVDQVHADKVAAALAERCRILRRHGLRGAWFATEPQVLPEAVFAAHPGWRGPRVDQPNRSRTARFAPCVAQPEVRALYARAMRCLVEACPEIDTFIFLTIDSGSGLCWAPALYPGPNGCSACSEHDVGERAVAFVRLLHDAAREAGHPIELDLHEIEPRSWMRKAFPRPAELAARLDRGMSINLHEGPDGRRFLPRRFGGVFWNTFYPVVGLPRPVDFLRRLIDDRALGCSRSVGNFNDSLNTALNATVFRTFLDQPADTELGGLNLLRRVAAVEFGEVAADDVMAVWMAIDDAEKQLASLDFGPFLIMGGLLARWLTRPFVPFPEELNEDERAIFRPYLFQARDEASALNLIDIQAMRMFEGWSARLLVEQTVEATDAHLRRALVHAGRLEDGPDGATWRPLGRRLEILRRLLRCGFHAVAYQAQLDRLKGAACAPAAAPPPLGCPAAWELRDLVSLARAEIDNTHAIATLLDQAPAPLLDLTPRGMPETILRLGADLGHQLRRKIEIMNRKWTDYNRLSPPANP